MASSFWLMAHPIFSRRFFVTPSRPSATFAPMPPFAFLYRSEVLLGRLFADAPDPAGTDAAFEPAEAFEDVRAAFERAAADPEGGWLRWLAPLHLSLVFPDGTRTGDFVLRLDGQRARVTWTREESRESGE